MGRDGALATISESMIEQVEDIRASLEGRFTKLNAALDWKEEQIQILQKEVSDLRRQRDSMREEGKAKGAVGLRATGLTSPAKCHEQKKMFF